MKLEFFLGADMTYLLMFSSHVLGLTQQCMPVYGATFTKKTDGTKVSPSTVVMKNQ